MKTHMLMTFGLAACLLAAPAPAATVAADGASAMGVDGPKKPQKKATKKPSSKKSAATPAKPATGQQVQQPASEGTGLGGLLGGIASAATGGASSTGNGGGSILSGLTSIFNAAKAARQSDLVGTWTYTEPAVVFSSSNALKSIGGKVASQTIENQLRQQFDRFGIKKGMMTMTFDKGGNFTQTVNGKSMSGTYTVRGHDVTLKYGGNVQQFVGTTQIDGNDLLIVMDASKLLKYAKAIGVLTGNSLLNSAGNLIGSMDGMQVGLKLNR